MPTAQTLARPSTGWLLRERARPERIRVWPHAWTLAVATVCFGAFMGQLDASVVTLVFRPVGAQFGAGLAAVEWVSLAYLLTLVALLVPVGRISDTRGRKLLYLYGFVVFTGASAACAMAPDLGMLIGFRVVQAVGASLLQANSVALVTTAAPSGRRRDALGLQAAAQALGLALGPSVGGILVSTLGWRWVFFINVPVGVVAVVGGHYLLPRTHERAPSRPMDWPGVALLAAATTSVMLALSAGSGLAVPSVVIAGFAIAAVTAGFGFVARQRRAAVPLVDVALLADRAVTWGLAGALGGYLILFGPLVLVPYVLLARGIPAWETGLVLTALPAGFAAAAIGAGRILPSSLSETRRAALGALMCATALGPAIALPISPIWLVPLLAVIGVGLGIFTPSNNHMIMGAVPARTSATAGGLINLARGLGTALGVAAITFAVNVGGHRGLLGGNHLAWLILLAAAVFTIASNLVAGAARHRPSHFIATSDF